MTEDMTEKEAEATNRAAALLARAIRELQQALPEQSAATLTEIAEMRRTLGEMAGKIDQQLGEERQQRLMLAGQLTGLATALDNLVSHLHGLSQLMADLLDRLAPPPDETPLPAVAQGEQPFLPGGEGMTLTLLNVPGFQALMDFQKVLTGLDEVAGASVERFQEGDSRLLVRLQTRVLGSELAEALRRATGHAIVVEESKPELQSLRLRVVSPT